MQDHMTLADVEARFIGSDYFPVAIGDRVDATQDGVVRARVRIVNGAPVITAVGRNGRRGRSAVRAVKRMLTRCQ